MLNRINAGAVAALLTCLSGAVACGSDGTLEETDGKAVLPHTALSREAPTGPGLWPTDRLPTQTRVALNGHAAPTITVRTITLEEHVQNTEMLKARSAAFAAAQATGGPVDDTLRVNYISPSHNGFNSTGSSNANFLVCSDQDLWMWDEEDGLLDELCFSGYGDADLGAIQRNPPYGSMWFTYVKRYYPGEQAGWFSSYPPDYPYGPGYDCFQAIAGAETGLHYVGFAAYDPQHDTTLGTGGEKLSGRYLYLGNSSQGCTP